MPTYTKITCKFCNQIFEVVPRNKKQQFCNTTCFKSFKSVNRRTGLNNCLVCNNILVTGQYKFCSHSCSAIHNNPNRIIKKFCKKCNITFTDEHTCPKIIKSTKKIYQPRIRYCAECNTKLLNNKKKYCETCYPNIRHYRSLASFTFNIYNYPDQFDLNLISTHGWFSPNGYNRRNKTPNLSGVSRDHLYTIADGFKNKIDPKILSHPANCALILHNGPNGNNSKKCSNITLDELLLKISNWNL